MNNMYKIEPSYLAIKDSMFVGMFNDIDFDEQFKTTRKDTNVYIFRLGQINDDGITLVSPLDKTQNTVPFDNVKKIKDLVSGEILSLHIFKPVDAKEVVNYFMENEEPKILHTPRLTENDFDMAEVIITEINISGGKIGLLNDGGIEQSSDDLFEFSESKTFG